MPPTDLAYGYCRGLVEGRVPCSAGQVAPLWGARTVRIRPSASPLTYPRCGRTRHTILYSGVPTWGRRTLRPLHWDSLVPLHPQLTTLGSG